MKELHPVPLTAEAFAPYGVVFELRKDAPGTRDLFAAPMENLRAGARLNVAVSRPKPKSLPLTVEKLERHPYSSQSFIPMDLSRHLILVCPLKADGTPDVDSALAFYGTASQGFVYHHNVWHHPFTALDRNAECVTLRFDDGSDADTEWFTVANGPTVVDGG